MTRVFVSHATPDGAFAERLAGDLRAFGIDAWLDSSHMGPGDFVARISAALERDVLILVLTPAAVASPWVQQEMNAAITRANQNLMRPPVIVQAATCAPNTIPGLWTVYHRYDATSDYMPALASVVKELGGGGAPLPSIISARAGDSVPKGQPKPSPRWSPSYPWIVSAPVAGAIVGLLLAISTGALGNGNNPIWIYVAVIAWLGLLVGLVGMIGNLIAHRSRAWTIALIASLIPAFFLGISIFLVVVAYGLYGPRPERTA